MKPITKEGKIRLLEAENQKLRAKNDELWKMYLSALDLVVDYRMEAEELYCEKYERYLADDVFCPVRETEKFLKDNYEKYKKIKKGDINEYINRKV